VGGTGEGEGISVGATEVEATPQPAEAINSANARKTNPTDFFITLSPIDLMVHRYA
jgi:hypothetical protein